MFGKCTMFNELVIMHYSMVVEEYLLNMSFFQKQQIANDLVSYEIKELLIKRITFCKFCW